MPRNHGLKGECYCIYPHRTLYSFKKSVAKLLKCSKENCPRYNDVYDDFWETCKHKRILSRKEDRVRLRNSDIVIIEQEITE